MFSQAVIGVWQQNVSVCHRVCHSVFVCVCVCCSDLHNKCFLRPWWQHLKDWNSPQFRPAGSGAALLWQQTRCCWHVYVVFSVIMGSILTQLAWRFGGKQLITEWKQPCILLCYAKSAAWLTRWYVCSSKSVRNWWNIVFTGVFKCQELKGFQSTVMEDKEKQHILTLKEAGTQESPKR